MIYANSTVVAIGIVFEQRQAAVGVAVGVVNCGQLSHVHVVIVAGAVQSYRLSASGSRLAPKRNIGWHGCDVRIEHRTEE